MKKLILGVAIVGALLAGAIGAELGTPAAQLKISEWVKGKSVDLAAVKGKQVVVVEFWATWCPPCRTSIPHLTEMQKKFKDVIFVGVTDEESDVVRKFVTKMGDKMDYVVAIDDNGQTSKGYMQAFGIGGIPHAFIVDKEGRVVWQGHPMAGLDAALESIVAGKFDLEAEKVRAKKEAEAEAEQERVGKKLQQLAQMISAGKDNEETKKLETELVALEKELGDIMGGEKFDPAEFRKRVLFGKKVQKYQRAYLASASAAELEKLEQDLQVDAPASFNLKQFKESMASQLEAKKAEPVLESYMEAVGENGDKAKAAELAKQVEALQLKSPQLLNEIAWAILTSEHIKVRDLELATKLAKAGVASSGGKEAGILDTYARALFDSGKVAEAIEQQKRAVAAAADEELKKDLTATLKMYQDKAATKSASGA
ncbi:MAG: TlpA disulfide reductase family protein [Verrucomicrobiota bacterium]